MKKILLLGSGELGKELVISLKRLGQWVCAVDSYERAPAMQVADEFRVINMLDGEELDRLVDEIRPDLVVPEIEAIRTERFYAYEKSGIQVVPSAKAANFTMNRRQIRDLAASDLGLKTAAFEYANSLEGFEDAVKKIGLPCVVKPIMSSSGKGQSVVKSSDDIEKAWNYALDSGRGDQSEVIVEEFINFELEITLLTVTQAKAAGGNTLFCAPIGHRQERGDYQESWQPAEMNESLLVKAQDMAAKITAELGGAGIWGVEFFITSDDVYFSELSPRPHDTGMVTLNNNQNFNEFELHARAILGLPIASIEINKKAVSSVILSEDDGIRNPVFIGLEDALKFPNSDLRIFGKPITRRFRRMGVALSSDSFDFSMTELRKRTFEIASAVKIIKPDGEKSSL